MSQRNCSHTFKKISFLDFCKTIRKSRVLKYHPEIQSKNNIQKKILQRQQVVCYCNMTLVHAIVRNCKFKCLICHYIYGFLQTARGFSIYQFNSIYGLSKPFKIQRKKQNNHQTNYARYFIFRKCRSKLMSRIKAIFVNIACFRVKLQDVVFSSKYYSGSLKAAILLLLVFSRCNYL